MSAEWDGSRTAPQGMLRVVGADTFQQPPEEYLIGDFDDADAAEDAIGQELADSKGLTFIMIFGSKGQVIGSTGGEQEPAPARAKDEDGPAVDITEVCGIPVVIETKKGEQRSGDGWSVTLPYDYGYIDGVTGADGDSLDVAVGPGSNGWAYIFDQKKLDGEGFDEHKCFINFPSAQAALDAFHAGHHRAQDVLMDWTPMPISEFKKWMRSADLTKPAGDVE